MLQQNCHSIAAAACRRAPRLLTAPMRCVGAVGLLITMLTSGCATVPSSAPGAGAQQGVHTSTVREFRER